MGKQYTNTVIKMEIKFKKIYYMDQLFWGGLRLRPQKQFFGGRVPHPPVIAAQKAVKRALCSCYHIK